MFRTAQYPAFPPPARRARDADGLRRDGGRAAVSYSGSQEHARTARENLRWKTLVAPRGIIKGAAALESAEEAAVGGGYE